MTEREYIAALERDLKAANDQIERLHQAVANLVSCARKAQRIMEGETE